MLSKQLQAEGGERGVRGCSWVWGALLHGPFTRPLPRAGLSSNSSGQGGKGAFLLELRAEILYVLHFLKAVAQSPWLGCWLGLAVPGRSQVKG